jgi:hypothetical protein
MDHKPISIAMFALLSAFVLLYYGMLYFQLSSPVLAAFFVGAALLCVGIAVQNGRTKRGRHTLAWDLEVFGATLAGGVATFGLSGYDAGFGTLGAVIAASAVGLLGCEALHKLGAPRLAAPLYCGAFVGMSSAAFFSFSAIAAASLIAGAVYVASDRVFTESGGKLGTIAFVGTTAIRKLLGG